MSFFGRLTCNSETKEPSNRLGWKVDGDTIKLDLSQVSELVPEGAGVRLEDPNLDIRVLLVHGIDGKYYAYKNACACGGFRIDLVPGEEKIRCCTLGQSTYDYEGNNVSGPAQKNLTLFSVEREQETLTINLVNLGG